MFDYFEEGIKNYILYRDRNKVEYEQIEFQKYIYDKKEVVIGIQVLYSHGIARKTNESLYQSSSVLMDDGKTRKLRVVWTPELAQDVEAHHALNP